MKENVVKIKSYEFAVDIVILYKFISENKKEYVLSKQMLRSGTSIGAMVKESEHSESKADFIHQLSIALKEANETEYWIELLKDSGFLSETEFIKIINDLKTLLRLLIAIIKTSKGN